mmetsp:Transcript_8289/g.19808  ORF Transcript_8289/g.19808 Transcript_8289/m.19808 type:complete len:432 (+) Transcript_8289:974-2269(+)
MVTDCFCCVKTGADLPGCTLRTLGKSPAHSTALSTSGLSAFSFAALRSASLVASDVRWSEGSSPSSASCPQYCCAASLIPCSVRSERKWRSQNLCAAAAPASRRTCSHLRCASSTARWSDCSLLNVSCAARASSRLAKGARNGERSERAAAMRRMGSAQRSSAPKRMSLPVATSTGSAARWRPRGVSCSSASSAPVRCSEEMAAVTAASGGSSRASEKAERSGVSERSGERRSCKHSSCNGPRSISGLRAASMYRTERKRVYSLKTCPARTRPARPARCRASACEIHTSTSRRMFLRSSNIDCLARPASITNTASSMVMEVSAMFVASTTLRTPGGIVSNTADCSAGDSDECSGSRRNLSALPKRFVVCSPLRSVEMSAMPGRKMSTAPSPKWSSMCASRSEMRSWLITCSLRWRSTARTPSGLLAYRASS